MEAFALPDLWAGYPVRREEVLEGYGSGMICRRAVESGEVLLRLDLSVCWTAETARASGALAELGDLAAELSEATQIALHLLVVSNGAAAERFRHEHVKTMCATTTETLLDWTDEELEVLAGSKWQMVAHEMREDIIAEHAELEEVIGDFLQTHGITQEKFLWAHKILLSRAMTFYREGGSRLMVLGPGQDMFNHSCEAVGYEDVKLETVEGKDMLVIRAFKPFAEGEQAFYSYSPASNGRLLLMGGFVVPGNPFDSVELMLTFPVNPSSAPLFQQLAEGLRSAPLTDGVAVAEETQDEFLQLLPPPPERHTEAALHVRLMAKTLSDQLERVLAFLRLDELSRSLGADGLSSDRLAASDSDPNARRRALTKLRALLQQLQGQFAA
ncbi:LSMT-L [Symbiodinium sp. CCMP2592]|nr:LSMT-L [Symbiodinium sp. CCMP2592]